MGVKNKLRPDGIIEEYKAHLVAKDYVHKGVKISMHSLLDLPPFGNTFPRCLLCSCHSSNGHEDIFPYWKRLG